MENLEWYPVFYNGLETNIEVTKCGKAKKVPKDWYAISKMSTNANYGIIDFTKLKPNHKGYKRVGIQIKGLKPKTVQLHQLVAAAFLNYKWQGMLMVVDHIDNNNVNNHVSNLQVITNRQNSSKEKTIKSGLPVGVCFVKERNKYISQIRINKKQVYLGYFKTPEEASNAYQEKLKSLLI